MNKLVQRLESLTNRISLIQFSDYLSKDDWDTIKKLKAEARDIEAQLKGYSGIAVEFKYVDTQHYSSDRPFYLTANSSLCFSQNPTIFDSQEEAEMYLSKACIKDLKEYIITFKQMQY